MATKKFTVPLTRTTIDKAEVEVEAPDKRTAGFMAAQASPEWRQESQTTKVGTVEERG